MILASCLFNVDLAAGRRRRLRDEDAKNSVLQARLDCILVNPMREGEGAVEFADGALRDPVLRLGRLGLGLRDFVGGGGFGD